MRLFRTKSQKVIKLLQDSKQDFQFDQDNTKARLLMAMGSKHLSKTDTEKLIYKPSLWPKHVFAGSLAMIIALGTTGLAFAASFSSPGTTLFQVQKFQNHIVLSLPLPETQKEEFSANIAAHRIEELNNFEIENVPEETIEANIEESSKSLDEALSRLTVSKKLQTKDNTKTSNLIKRLDDISNQHQKRLEVLKATVKSEKIRDEIEKNLTNLASKRAKLQEKVQDSEGSENRGQEKQSSD